MLIKISDKILIERPPAQPILAGQNSLKNLLVDCTYSNPEYYQKMNMGLSVWSIPKEIQTYKILNDGNIEFLRGEFIKVINRLPPAEIEYEHPEPPPHKLQYINNDFPLDNLQEECVATIKTKIQGVVHAVTSAGKTLIILKSICELKQRALIVVHRKILMQQFLEDIEKYIRDEHGNKIKPGIVGDGKSSFGDITVALDKSLSKHLQEAKDYFGVVFLDECHLAPANTMLSLINSINSKHRFGFSGTLKRKDQKEFLIFATFGRVIYEINKEQLLEKDRVVPVKVKVIHSESEFDWNSVAEEKGVMVAHKELEKYLANDRERNFMVAQIASQLPGKTIVLTRNVQPCYDMQNILGFEFNISSGVITGRNSKEALESYELMKHANLQLIFATIGCVSTGVSISDLDNLVLASPVYNNELLLHQMRGRLMRTAPGKKYGTFYFVYDYKIFPDNKLQKLLRILEK